MKILICEDDEALVSIIRFKLNRENFCDVDVATDGRDAIQLLSLNDYDLILSDIHMPFHSGLEIISHTRTTLNKNTPIIIFSAEGLEETVLLAFSMGANDFISKPFSPTELSVRIKKLLKL